jgi:hypothetical protein
MTITAERAHTGSLAGGEGRPAQKPATFPSCADRGPDEARQAWDLAKGTRR